MKKWILLLPIIMILGCAPTETVVAPEPTKVSIEEVKEQLKEEIAEEVNEEIKKEETKEEITIDNYDYKTDPDTLIVNIGNNNIDQYFDLQIIQSNGKYYVATHSLMYDKGYVMVGIEHCDVSIRYLGYEYEGKIYSLPDTADNCWLVESPFNFYVASHFTSEESAQKFLIGLNDCHPTFKYNDATIYYQKIEDVKFGYEITEDGLRIVNGEELYINPNNPY